MSKKAIFDAANKRAAKLEAKGKAVDFDELLRMGDQSQLWDGGRPFVVKIDIRPARAHCPDL